MADRVYLGRLATIQSRVFPESAGSFNQEHAGGLEPFTMLVELLVHGEVTLSNNGSREIWVHHDGAWARITEDGDFELGLAGV